MENENYNFQENFVSERQMWEDMVVWTNSHMWKLPYLPMNFHSIHCAVWNLYSNKSFLLVRFEFEWISPVYPPNINMETPCTWQENINNKLYRQQPQTSESKTIHDYMFQCTPHAFIIYHTEWHTPKQCLCCDDGYQCPTCNVYACWGLQYSGMLCSADWQ